ncbi:helix-turn-helix transcriptional regulator [Solibacillus isronensis]|uniref:helix-turn-helix transcriptional regulator n=1 Tax=Solibacillus isronensis TaxID=412383 RepID=UPI00399FBA3E
MNNKKVSQVYRVLSIYERLKNGEKIHKSEVAARFLTSEKSIQRDLQSIRDFIELENTNEYLDYDRSKRAYVLETASPRWLRNEDIFAVLKVLIESRAFPKVEMTDLINKLTSLAKKEDQHLIQQMMLNEKHLYVELHHKKELIEILWKLSLAIQSKRIIKVNYKREFDEEAKRHDLKPVGIMFSEFYFYLIAYSAAKDFDFPTIYRIDRIEHFEQTAVAFKVPYIERFQEGEFRKRVQFMYPGELITVKFKFTGPSPQAVMDRLPTARVVEKFDGGLIFEAEVFGNGGKMWLLSQGENVEILQPLDFRNEILNEIGRINELYHY